MLGLLASTFKGIAQLKDLGYEAVLDIHGRPIGLCLPADLTKFLLVDPADEMSTNNSSTAQSPTGFIKFAYDSVDQAIIAAVENLSMHLLATDSSRTLVSLKQKHPEKFASKRLLERILISLESYRFRQPVRRFIFEFFAPAVRNYRVDPLSQVEDSRQLEASSEEDEAGS